MMLVHSRTFLSAACLALAAMCLLSGCSVLNAGGAATPSPAAVQTPEPTAPPTPSPSPSPSPTPTPEPTPTPTPEPTPTPDPWAGFFSDTPVIQFPDSKTNKDKWIYTDKSLSITIDIRAILKRKVFVAEIYTRGPLLTSGMADPEKPTSVKKPWYIARKHKAVFALSSDYWHFTRLTMAGQKEIKTPKGVMLRGGKVLMEKDDNETIAVMPDGELKLFEKGKITSKELLTLGVKDSYSFGPVLVKDGQINPDIKKHTVYKAINKANARCSIGMVEPGHYFVVVNQVGNGCTFDQLAQIHLELGSRLAYNLDGGNSAAIVFMGEQINPKKYDESLNSGQRSIPDLICIGTSDDVPGLKDPVKGTK